MDSTNTYTTGTQQVATIRFTVPANAQIGLTPVTFGGVPTAQSVSSPQGALLTTTYQGGNVQIGSTAAGVGVSGRVVTPDGRGIRNSTVTLRGTDGLTRTATTSSFGVYVFENVESGQSYIVGVSSKRYRFAARIVQVTDSLSDVDFIGME